jgi:psiF repeat
MVANRLGPEFDRPRKRRGAPDAEGDGAFTRGSASGRDSACSSTRGIPMMTLSSRIAATAIASLLLVGSAFAQSTKPAAAPATRAPVVHSAASLECSKEADAKGLHGKERKKFRSECKKAAAAKPN